MKRIIEWVSGLFSRKPVKYEIDVEEYVEQAQEVFNLNNTVCKLMVSEASRIKEAARAYTVTVQVPEKKTATGFVLSEAREEEEVRYEPYYKSNKSTREHRYILSTEGKVVGLVPKELCSLPRQ